MPRRTWLDNHLDALLAELSSFHLNVPRTTAAELLRDQVHSLAQDMDVSERTARGYVTPEMIRELARTLAFSIADEHPGADVFELPRNAVVPWPGIGRLFTALAEAGHVRLVNGDPDGEAAAFQLISAFGLLANDAQLPEQHGAPERGGVACPPAMLIRAARFLEVTAGMLCGGARMAGDGDPGMVEDVARQMSSDAASLRAHVPAAESRG